MDRAQAAKLIDRYEMDERGQGDPDCKDCGGDGSIHEPSVKAFRRCECQDRIEEAYAILDGEGPADLLARQAARERASALAYLRALPAGGIGELLNEAKVAEWVSDRDNVGLCYLEPVGDANTLGRTDTHPSRPMVLASARGSTGSFDFLTEPEARSWVEAQAIADGWTIPTAAP